MVKIRALVISIFILLPILTLVWSYLIPFYAQTLTKILFETLQVNDHLAPYSLDILSQRLHLNNWIFFTRIVLQMDLKTGTFALDLTSILLCYVPWLVLATASFTRINFGTWLLKTISGSIAIFLFHYIVLAIILVYKNSATTELDQVLAQFSAVTSVALPLLCWFVLFGIHDSQSEEELVM